MTSSAGVFCRGWTSLTNIGSSNEGDVEERKHWDRYMQAYESALNATSRPWAPWYAIPADDKPYMRVCIAEIIVETLKQLDLRYPVVTDEQKQDFAGMRELLERG